MMRLFGVCLVVCLSVGLTVGYPRGAPETTCDTMEPFHEGSRRNTGRNPYSLEAEVTDNSVAVRLSGPPFRGYMLQGFSPRDPREVIGTFSTSNNTISCSAQNRQNTATHSDPTDKTDLVFEWTPPPQFKGDIIFRATVVRNYGLYHSNLYSNKAKF